MTDHNNLEQIYQTAQTAAQLASTMCLEFKHGKDHQNLKQDKSWVTEADQKIEHELRKLILKNHPTHFILGEEEGGKISSNENDFTWIIDPIDGTFSFVHNVPFYSSLIAVLKGSTPIIGFACLPAMNITMSAQLGKGTFINEKKYEKPTLVGNSCVEIIATSDVYRFYMENKKSLVEFFYGPTKKSRTYGDALAYYLLLNGSVRAFVDPKVEIWDVAPFHVIMREAGFAIHSWSGENKLKKGTSISYALDDKKMPVNCDDVIEIIKISA